MGLVKRTYVDGETVITAENLNDIQDAIIQNEQDIATKGTYSKPSGGIPASDTAAGVQTSLGKADTAYQKPSGGIPSTDLASAVQTSLGKADSALQSSDIDNTLTVSGKAADAKKTGDEISDVRNTLTQLEDNLVSETLVRTGATNTGNPITEGTYFYLNGALVKAKTNIANGATFTDGTNYEAVTVGEELTALNTELSPKAGTVTMLVAGNSNLLVMQCGHVVAIWGYIEGLTLTANTEQDIAQISGVLFPAGVVRFRGAVGTNAYTTGSDAYVVIGKSGKIGVNPPVSGSVVYFNATYIR